MRYLVLIYNSEAALNALSEEERGANWAGYGAFNAEVGQRGVLRAGEPLQPSATATTVRVRDGKTLTTDGPFAETHEQLGGFYLLDCKDLDEAIELAAKIPDAQMGSIEIRPIFELGNNRP
ncbi:MAG: YciI family protein [bacterium]|nr:YciI family protein [bacterium]